uniref:Ycf15 n=1 Tax=Caragana rosea var. rosea TaxID=2051892 RepID=A0A3G1KJY6_9FABA|nr:Ycf15 [Caragana rosea var. rosea]ATQ37566.1 Ycf15 [Caragana rosea var. rosea]WFG49818.1 Ycf15 [Caragana rosea]WFG49895.1 Ycf15 [Caragana rosea]
MRVQPHCIARTHVVYWKEVDDLLSHVTILLPRSSLSPRSTETKSNSS